MARRRRHPGRPANGATDELGYHAVEHHTMVADLYATILHQLGLDHKRVNFHMHGRDERLTDDYPARVLNDLLVSWDKPTSRIGASMTVVARTPRPCGSFSMLATSMLALFVRTDEASVPRVKFAKLRQLMMRRSQAFSTFPTKCNSSIRWSETPNTC